LWLAMTQGEGGVGRGPRGGESGDGGGVGGELGGGEGGVGGEEMGEWVVNGVEGVSREQQQQQHVQGAK
jgi:hypothetical protein